MTITSVIVVFSVTWFIVFFILLQLGSQTQGEAGHVEPGTPPGAPAGFPVGRKARRATMIALALSALIIAVVSSGWITIADLDLFNRGVQRPADGTGG